MSHLLLNAWETWAILYVIAGFTTGSVVVRRFAKSDKYDYDSAVIPLATVVVIVWPVFWIIAIYGELRGKT